MSCEGDARARVRTVRRRLVVEVDYTPGRDRPISLVLWLLACKKFEEVVEEALARAWRGRS